MSDLTHAQPTAPTGLLRSVAGPFRWMAEIFDSFRRALELSQAYEELSRLSDADLARRGLARDDIIRHIYAEIV